MTKPETIQRFGGLALGESTHLVDELRAIQPGELECARPLVADPDGDLTLSIWPNHVGSLGTAWGQYRLEMTWNGAIPESAWISIQRN